MHRIIAILAIAVFVIGCRSVDVAARHVGPPPQCEIHQVEMQPEWIRVSSGEMVYQMAYLDVVRQHFPHHGGVILSGEREFRNEFERRVRDFVCPACTHAYNAYWQEHGHK